MNSVHPEGRKCRAVLLNCYRRSSFRVIHNAAALFSEQETRRIRHPERSAAESKGLQSRNVRFLDSLRSLEMTVTGKFLSSGTERSGVESQRRVAVCRRGRSPVGAYATAGSPHDSAAHRAATRRNLAGGFACESGDSSTLRHSRWSQGRLPFGRSE